MRLVLQKFLNNEIRARQKFFYETFRLWLLVHSNNDTYVDLVSIPMNCLDIFFIVGHNTFVKNFLQHNTIIEEKIVAITCDGTINLSSMRLPSKTIYLPHQNEENYADLLKGNLYGFEFDLTESELLLYNTNKSDDITQRLKISFTQL